MIKDLWLRDVSACRNTWMVPACFFTFNVVLFSPRYFPNTVQKKSRSWRWRSRQFNWSDLKIVQLCTSFCQYVVSFQLHRVEMLWALFSKIKTKIFMYVPWAFKLCFFAAVMFKRLLILLYLRFGFGKSTRVQTESAGIDDRCSKQWLP